METNYLSETSFPITKNNYVVISGCSGGGKSSLLSALAERGYAVVEEPGRQIVKEQQAIDGDALPWVNPSKFLELALSRYIYQFNVHSKASQTIFFDRSIIDALQLEGKQGNYFQKAAENFRYNPRVFLVPPWEEIFASDGERKHDFAAAKKEFDELLIKYKNLGYETVIIPKMSIDERVDFIVKALKTKFILYIATSKDGFIADVNGNLDWLPQTVEQTGGNDYGYQPFYDTVEALAIGRKTYEQILTFGTWPYHGKKCYIFSSMPDATENPDIEFVTDDVDTFLKRLEEKNIHRLWLVGGAGLVDSFSAKGKIDEYIITIFPVVLGAGIPLRMNPKISQISSVQCGDGVVQERYNKG